MRIFPLGQADNYIFAFGANCDTLMGHANNMSYLFHPKTMQQKYHIEKTHTNPTTSYYNTYSPEVVVNKTEEELAKNTTVGGVQSDSAPPPYEESNRADNEEEDQVQETVEAKPQDQEQPQSQDSQHQPQEDGIQPLSNN